MDKITNKQAWGQVLGKVKSMHDKILTTKDTKPFQDYLKFVASRYQYSFYNSMLIYSQAGNVVTMSGKKWQAINRKVTDYTKKIWILCPKFAWLPLLDNDNKEQHGENGKVIKHKVLVGFNEGYIYSIDNTSGQPLPVNPLNGEWELSDSDTGLKYYPMIVEALKNKGISINEFEANNNGLKGSTGGKDIKINANITNTDKLLVIAHEYAHYTLHFNENRQALSKERKELEAETVAWLVAERLGLKSNSINYNALYQKDYNLMDSLSNIFKAYNQVIDMLGLKPVYEKPKSSKPYKKYSKTSKKSKQYA